MKNKMMLFAVMLTAFVFLANFSNAQDEKKCCDKDKSKNTKECTNVNMDKKECTKTGTSEGVSDSAKVCPVSGEKIDGSEGTPVKYTYLGKEYTFCCGGCVKKFKAEPMNYIKGDMTCSVMGEVAKKDISTVVDGVKYYFCCEMCVKKFEKDPEKYKDGFKAK